MPIVAEMFRDLPKEEVKLDDNTNSGWMDMDATGQGFTKKPWTTQFTDTLVLSEERIVYLWLKGACQNAYGNFRVLLDGVPILAMGGSTGPQSGDEIERDMYLVLPAGSYTLKWQASAWASGTSGDVFIRHRKVATLDFPDREDGSVDSGNISVGVWQSWDPTTTIIDQSFTMPSAREVATASLQKGVKEGYISSPDRKVNMATTKEVCLMVTAYMETVDLRRNEPIDPGESPTEDMRWTIEVDGTQVAWDESRKDNGGGNDDNPDTGEGAFGRIAVKADAGASVNVKVKAENQSGSSQTCRAVIRVVATPWMIPNEAYQPVTLDFPQFSTIYVTMEPLEEDPTKTLKLGKTRFVSFGDASDFYSTETGTGVVSWSYKFDEVEVDKVDLLVTDGYGGCISILGVDIR